MANIASFSSAVGSVIYVSAGTPAATVQFIAGDKDSIIVSAPEYKYDYPSTPGVNGTGSKNFGFRNQRVSLRVVYIDSSQAAVLEAYGTDMQILAAAPSTLLLPSLTFDCCILNGSATNITKVKMCGTSANFMATATIVVDSKRQA